MTDTTGNSSNKYNNNSKKNPFDDSFLVISHQSPCFRWRYSRVVVSTSGLFGSFKQRADDIVQKQTTI